jgi:hypothetical protein
MFWFFWVFVEQQRMWLDLKASEWMEKGKRGKGKKGRRGG